MAATLGALAACTGRAVTDPAACYEEGVWDLAGSWCQYGANLIPYRDEIMGRFVGIAISPPEGGCGACDGRAIDEMMEERIILMCGDGEVEWERGCRADDPFAVYDPNEPGPPNPDNCFYYAFVWGDTCDYDNLDGYWGG